MELNTISLPVFVQLANVIFEKKKDSLQQFARSSGMFRIENIPQNTGNTRQYTEIDLEEYANRKNESDQASRARVQQGYTKFLTSYRIAKDIGISYEMRTQNKYNEVITRLENLADLAMNRMDLDLTHRITFSTATTYVDMDGVTVDISVGDTLALASTVHTLKGSSTTYASRLAGNPQISKGSLEGMEKLVVENTFNQFGQKVTLKNDRIFCGDDPNTNNTIDEYLQSSGAPDFNNSGVKNVYNGKYTKVVLPRLATDANGGVDTNKRKYWGTFSSVMTQAHLGIWEEPHLKSPGSIGSTEQSSNANGEEFSTDDWNFGVRAGYGIAILSGIWFRLSTGDGTP
jgi:hypothetical protein